MSTINTVDGLPATIFEQGPGWTVETTIDGQLLYLNDRGLWSEVEHFWDNETAARMAAAGNIEDHWCPVRAKRPGFAVRCFDGVDAIVTHDGHERWTILAWLAPKGIKYQHYLAPNGVWDSGSSVNERWPSRLEAIAFAKQGPEGRLGMRGVPRIKSLEIIERCPVCRKEYVYDTEQDAYEGTIELVGAMGAGSDGTKTVTLHLCPADRGVIAVTVDDEHGGTLYEPSRKEL